MHRHFFLSLLIFMYCGMLSMFAAQSNFYFKTLSVEDGLSQNMIYAILQDRQGFMWFGTQDGLNRYDGNSFRVYKKDLFSESSLKSDAVFSLAEGNDSLLWIGTDNGVALYDPVLEKFTQLDLGNKNKNGIVRSIVKDAHGNMWLALSDEGIICVAPDRKQTFYSLDKYLGRGRGMIRQLCLDGNGFLWIATYRQGILKLDPSTGNVKQFFIDEAGENVADNDVNCLSLLDSNILLLGTVNHGVMAMHLHEETLSPFLTKDGEEHSLFVRYIYVDNKNSIWLGTETGMYIYTLSDQSLIHLQHVFNDPYSIPDNAIHSIYQDRKGGMWIGTFFGGVCYFAESYARFEKYYPMEGKENALGGKSISEFCEDTDNNIWIATEDGGLNCFNPLKKEFTKNFIPANNVHALYFDEQNDKLWIGTFSKGLYTLELKTGKKKNYRSSSLKNALNNDNIYAIYKDRESNMWIGTMNGLLRYIPQIDGFEQIKEKDISSQVNDIIEDADGRLWFATLGQGVFSYDRASDTWKHYPTVVESDTIRGRMIVCLLEDKERRIWLGTEGAGLVCYDREKDTFIKHYNVNNGLPNGVIYKILEDVNGCIWGATNKGLFCLEPVTGKVKAYTHFDGLLGDQFNYKSGLLSKSGKIYFGGVKGFVAFYPNNLLPSQEPPHIVFNSFQLNNVEVPVAEESILEQSITYTKKVRLPYNQSVFSIGFAALNYAPQPDIQYAYKLEGWDKDWINAAQSYRVMYSNLPPGQYTFYVRARNTESSWKECQSAMEIVILPPFYMTIWAYILYCILGILILYGLIREYTNRMQRRNRKAMEILEHKKETELYDAKINFFTNVTHEIRTPLSLIKAPLDEVMKNISETDGCYENLSIIQRNTNRLLKLVNELLDFRKTESKGLKLNFVHTNITEVVRETVKRFAPAAGVQNITFEECYPANEIIADVDVEVFTKILSNLFNNALKHAATFIKVSLDKRDDTFMLRVANDGDKIPKELAEKVFAPFFKLDEGSLGTGIGLPFARTLVESHQGRIFIDTDACDVTFVIILPCKQENVLTLLDEEEQTNVEPELHSAISLPETEDRKVILSVEDNEEFQSFMAKQLERKYKVLKAGNGQEALDVLAKNAVDLIISDVMMPVMDGMALCKTVKEDLRYSHIPVILLTAKTGLQAQLDGLKIGADEYIAKPYSADYLDARIENLLLNRRKIQEAYKQSPETKVEAIAHSKADEEFLNKLVEAIHSRLDEVDLDVDTLAVMMNMSRATLYRKVKSISELTPNDFIRLIRLKKAAELLREKEYRINEIAFIVGFSSSSYFSKCFYKQFGVLPKDFERGDQKGTAS